MAERRMFAKSIVLSDAFLDMPLSARCLYFTLGMFADDEGFVGNPRAIMRECGASNDDMLMLIGKRYVLVFDSGVIVIKHWKMNNYLQKDRVKPTTYLEEKSTLKVDEKGAYTEKEKALEEVIEDNSNMLDEGMYTKCIHSIDKYSIEENSLVESSQDNNNAPTLTEIQNYVKEKGYHIDSKKFFDYYEITNWKIKGQPIENWKALVNKWESTEKHPTTSYDSNQVKEKAQKEIVYKRKEQPKTEIPFVTPSRPVRENFKLFDDYLEASQEWVRKYGTDEEKSFLN